MPLGHLGDDCLVRITAADPPLDAAAWARLEAALAKLFAQFEREGRVGAWGCERAAGGAAVVIAWSAPEGVISGCSHDKLARLLLAHEEGGRRLVNAPPILIEVDGSARCLDRAGLRGLVGQGRIGPSTPVYDLRAETLGAWRRGRKPLRETPLARILPHGV
jgi:hypothetical protein